MVAKNDNMHKLNCCLVFCLAIISAATFAIDVYFNYAFSSGHYVRRDTKEVSDRTRTQITPASWVFSIWGVIYGAFAIWYIYVFYLMCCRAQRNKSPLFPGIFWILFIIVNVLNASWLYVYLNNGMIESGFILIAMTLILYLLNIIGFRVCWFDVVNYNENNRQDIEYNDDDVIELSSCEIKLLRLITLNGLPLYATWCSIATCVQWSSILKYYTFHWSDNVACIVTLSILSAILLIYWNMDLLTKREYFVWTWIPYFVLIAAFSAIIDRNNSFGGYRKSGLFYVFILLIITVFGLVTKFFTLCLCPPKCNNPRFSRV